MEGDPRSTHRLPNANKFLSTPSGWRATPPPQTLSRPCQISIHALRVEGDSYDCKYGSARADFYPRPPGGGRPSVQLYLASLRRFLSTPSGWRATNVAIDDRHCARISIHALRVEGDSPENVFPFSGTYFYPRPPGGGRLFHVCQRFLLDKFLSTPSGWRATELYNCNYIMYQFLSTPSGWRATLYSHHTLRLNRISIHALRVEGDSA